MLVPQGMAYAMIAGLPPVYGLYAALLPQVVYALMGTSRQLAVGPVAMDSLIVAAGLGALSLSGPQEYLALALFLAFFVGIIQLLMGFLKLGVFVHFLSRPVISGFTSAAAIIIGLSQLNHLLGVSIPRSNKILELFIYLIELIPQAHGLTVIISVLGVCFIFVLRRYFPKLPAALILVVLATVTVAHFKEVETGLILIENVPGGLPSLIMPSAEWGQVYALIPLALTLAYLIYGSNLCGESHRRKRRKHPQCKSRAHCAWGC